MPQTLEGRKKLILNWQEFNKGSVLGTIPVKAIITHLNAFPYKMDLWGTVIGKLKADRPHPHNYPHPPTDYRHTDKHPTFRCESQQ